MKSTAKRTVKNAGGVGVKWAVGCAQAGSQNPGPFFLRQRTKLNGPRGKK